MNERWEDIIKKNGQYIIDQKNRLLNIIYDWLTVRNTTGFGFQPIFSIFWKLAVACKKLGISVNSMFGFRTGRLKSKSFRSSTKKSLTNRFLKIYSSKFSLGLPQNSIAGYNSDSSEDIETLYQYSLKEN